MSVATKVGVIGLGMMGIHHVRIYHELPEARLVGLADPQEARRLEATRLAPDVPVFADYRHMLAETRPEAVTIAVPTLLHLGVGLDALDAGVHVLIEKPIAAQVEEGLRLTAAAEAQGRMLMVGHVERFNPAVQALRERLVRGDLGRVHQITAQRVGPFPARIRDVGVVHDLAPHDIDVMRFVLGEEVERLYAETQLRLNTEHEDILLGTLRFASGVIGVLDINWLTPQKVRRLRVLGDNGTYELDYLRQTLDFAPRGHDPVSPPPFERVWPPHPDAPLEEPLRIELREFLRAIRDGRPSPVAGADAIAALDIAAKLVESGLSGQAIHVRHPSEVQ